MHHKQRKYQKLQKLTSFKHTSVKKNQIWIWTTANHSLPGILAWVLGDRCAQTFEPLWKIIRSWKSFWYVTDGWLVYPCFINDCDHLVLKTYMTSDPSEVSSLWERASVD